VKSFKIPWILWLALPEKFDMRAIIPSLLFLLVLVSCNNSTTEKSAETKTVSKHSNSFNSSVQSAMDSYAALTEAFVNWDSNAVVSRAGELRTKLDSINFFGFVPQTVTAPVDTLVLAKKDLQAISSNNDLTIKRRHFDTLTQHLYAFLEKVQYDEKKIYLQECPMAFNDTESGHWLSPVDSIRNPYLGLHHPKYGKAMIDCGGNKSVIDFTSKK
jgi:hypothetical protein